VRLQSWEELLPATCRLVVERGAVDLAWISWANADTSQIAIQGTWPQTMRCHEFMLA
jgi:hypothetical protein